MHWAVTANPDDQSGYYRHLLTTDECLAGCTLFVFCDAVEEPAIFGDYDNVGSTIVLN